MENFVLYHEVYKKDGMIMYKGRKKGTITYVAVSCIEKDQRVKVTNHVRIAYELEHEHVVRFYEWYETSNHLWLVTDLCVGGSLQQMLCEDGSFPESSVRTFGAQLVRGLAYLHGRGVVCAQWHPSKIVLDGCGLLKYFDFSDARKLNEDHEQLVQRFFSGLGIESRDLDDLFDHRRPSAYSAPELLEGGPATCEADIWGLGCLLFEMACGHPPFAGTSPDELVQNVLHRPLIVPKLVQHGSRMAGRASTELTALLEQMLNKNPDYRISMAALCQHEFWRGALADEGKLPPSCSRDAFTSQKSVRPKTASQPGPDDGLDRSSSSSSSLTSTHVVAEDTISFTMHLGSARAAEPADRTATLQQHQPDSDRGRTRQKLFQLEPADELQTAELADPSCGDPQLQVLLDIAKRSSADTALKTRSSLEDYSRMLKDGRLKYEPKLLPVAPLSLVKLRALRKPDRDKHLKQIESAMKTVEKGPPSQRRLHMLNYVAQTCMSPEVSEFCLKSGVATELCKQLRQSSNQEMMVRACQLLAIALFHCGSSGGTDLLGDVPTEIALCAGDVLRDQFRCARVKHAALGALGEALLRGGCGEERAELHASLVTRCLHRTEDVATNLVAARLVDAAALLWPSSPLARHLATPDTMQHLLLCLRHAVQDRLKVSAAQAMSRLARIDPGLFSGLVDKLGAGSLLDNLHLSLLGVQEAVLEMFALALLSSQQQGSVSARRWTPLPPGSQQQQDSSASGGGGPTAVLVRSVMRLLETPAALVRAKALLLVLLLCRQHQDGPSAVLRIACEHRLVLYLEREMKRTSSVTTDTMETCLVQFTGFIGSVAVPGILEQCCSALKAVQGRKHPSAQQTRALRSSLPLLECVASLAASPALRAIVVTVPFCSWLGELLGHALRLVVADSTGAGSVPDNAALASPTVTAAVTSGVLGPELGPQFMSHVLALVEAAVHCSSSGAPMRLGPPSHLQEEDLSSGGASHDPDGGSNVARIVFEQLLEPLAALTARTDNPDIRIIGVKLCGDIVGIVIQSEVLDSPADSAFHKSAVNALSNAVESSLLPQMRQFLADPDPSAVYLLRLMRQYLPARPAQCVAIMRQHAFPDLLTRLIADHQEQRVMAAAVLESLLLVGAVAEAHAGLLRDLVVEPELVPLLCDTVLEVGELYHRDGEASLRSPKTAELLEVGLDVLCSLAKLVADVVRRALQSKKQQQQIGGGTGESGGAEEAVSAAAVARLTSEAEELLGAGKPLTEVVDLLVACLVGGSGGCSSGSRGGGGGDDDETADDVGEAALRLLHQVVSLYGGAQIQHALHPANLHALCTALLECSHRPPGTAPRQRRTLLRVLKRLLACGAPLPAEPVLDAITTALAQVRLSSTSTAEHDPVSMGLADDISRFIATAVATTATTY